jgi:transposase-like protein
MPRTTPASPPEFTAEAVRLVGSSDRSLSRIAKDLGVADQTLRTWVRHAESDGGAREALAPRKASTCAGCNPLRSGALTRPLLRHPLRAGGGVLA